MIDGAAETIIIFGVNFGGFRVTQAQLDRLDRQNVLIRRELSKYKRARPFRPFKLDLKHFRDSFAVRRARDFSIHSPVMLDLTADGQGISIPYPAIRRIVPLGNGRMRAAEFEIIVPIPSRGTSRRRSTVCPTPGARATSAR